MPFTLLQAGTSLQTMNTSGTLTTLTLPTGVVIDSTKILRTAVFGRYVVCVNSPTRPLSVDPDGVVRVLCPNPPRTRLVLSATGSGALTGSYLAKQTFLVLDGDGNIIAESELGPLTTAASLTAQIMAVTGIDLSSDTITASRLYRTVASGSAYFRWVDSDGNTQTTLQDDLADASLELLTAPTLGTPPNDLTLLAEYRGRLWGVSALEIDTIRVGEAGKMYAWPATSGYIVGKPGGDDRGITGLIPRKEFLLVGRRDAMFQMTGDAPANFRPVKLKQNVGIEAPDSVVVYKDVAWWLGTDGVYKWDDTGIENVAAGKVQSWFQTDTYFNRSRLRFAVGQIHPLQHKYRILLSNAGDTTLNRFIEYDWVEQKWWGPHTIDAFTPSFAGIIHDSNNLDLAVICSSAGFVYKDQATRTDDASTGIDFDVDTKFHDGNTPGITKTWLQPTLISKIQAAGTLTITPKVGGLDASAGTAISADMTKGREVLRRLGTGRFAQLRLRHTTAGQDVGLYGIEIPFFEDGVR